MSRVLAEMQAQRRPVPPSWLMERIGVSHEELYQELVHLEGEGLASFHRNFFERDSAPAEAGWYALGGIKG